MDSTLKNLQLLSPVDWRVLKEVRLRALQDSPNAFMSCYDSELRLSDWEWRRMFDASTWVVARDAENVVGLARSVAIRRDRGRVMSSPSGWHRTIAGAECSALCCTPWPRSSARVE